MILRSSQNETHRRAGERIAQEGRTGVLKGFKSKADKEFEAALVLGQDGKVGFDIGK